MFHVLRVLSLQLGLFYRTRTICCEQRIAAVGPVPTQRVCRYTSSDAEFFNYGPNVVRRR